MGRIPAGFMDRKQSTEDDLTRDCDLFDWCCQGEEEVKEDGEEEALRRACHIRTGDEATIQRHKDPVLEDEQGILRKEVCKEGIIDVSYVCKFSWW